MHHQDQQAVMQASASRCHWCFRISQGGELEQTDGHRNSRLRCTERVSQQNSMCFFWSSMRVVGHRSQCQLYLWYGLYSFIDVGCSGGCSASFDLCLRFTIKSPGCTAQSDSCVTASNIESTGLGFHTCTLKSWLSLTVSELSLSEGLQMSQRRAFHLTRGQTYSWHVPFVSINIRCFAPHS